MRALSQFSSSTLSGATRFSNYFPTFLERQFEFIKPNSVSLFIASDFRSNNQFSLLDAFTSHYSTKPIENKQAKKSKTYPSKDRTNNNKLDQSSDPGLVLWEKVQGALQPSVSLAKDKATQTSDAFEAFGNGDSASTPRRFPTCMLADEIEALHILYVRGKLNWLKGRYVAANGCLERGVAILFSPRTLLPVHLAMLVQVCNVGYGLNISLFKVLVDQVLARLRSFSPSELTAILRALAEIHSSQRQFQVPLSLSSSSGGVGGVGGVGGGGTAINNSNVGLSAGMSLPGMSPSLFPSPSLPSSPSPSSSPPRQQDDFILPVFLTAQAFLIPERLIAWNQQRLISASQIAWLCVSFAEMHQQVRRSGMAGSSGTNATSAILAALRQVAGELFGLLENSLDVVEAHVLTQLVLAYQPLRPGSGILPNRPSMEAAEWMKGQTSLSNSNNINDKNKSSSISNGSNGGSNADFGSIGARNDTMLISKSMFEAGPEFLNSCVAAALARVEEFDLQMWSRIEAVAERHHHPSAGHLKEVGKRFRKS